MEDELMSTSVESFSNSAPCIIARTGAPLLFSSASCSRVVMQTNMFYRSLEQLRKSPPPLPLLPTLKLHSFENILFLLPGKLCLVLLHVKFFSSYYCKTRKMAWKEFLCQLLNDWYYESETFYNIARYSSYRKMEVLFWGGWWLYQNWLSSSQRQI